MLCPRSFPHPKVQLSQKNDNKLGCLTSLALSVLILKKKKNKALITLWWLWKVDCLDPLAPEHGAGRRLPLLPHSLSSSLGHLQSEATGGTSPAYS